ncbi:MAG: biopolymer transporter ExbD [Pseudomonadota bacterium]
MKLQSGTREEPEVNLTSLIDVVLLLLVFFMVSTTFVKESEIKIRLPQAEASVSADKVDSIEIAVSSSGTYTVNQQSLVNSRPDTLRRALRKISDGDSTLAITIRADAEAKHQHVVTAMDVAGRLGFVNINIATTREPSAN